MTQKAANRQGLGGESGPVLLPPGTGSLHNKMEPHSKERLLVAITGQAVSSNFEVHEYAGWQAAGHAAQATLGWMNIALLMPCSHKKVGHVLAGLAGPIDDLHPLTTV